MSAPPFPPPDAPKKKPGLAWPVRVIVGIVGLIAVVSGVNQVRHGIGEIKGSSLDWQRRAVAGLSVELPGAPVKEDIQPAAEAAPRVKLMEMHGVKTNGALIKITHVAYTDAAKVSMDAELEGGKEALSASPGIDKLKMSVVETQVQNGPAKTMSADYTLPNFGEQHSESLYFSRGQESWVVVVMGVPAVVKEIAQRLLPSVQIAP
ncbi:MAG: hypothetical protein ABJF10_02485 [Chthoniobacter sp.]|uniref:hypothetical protein n=1 Tax=Chthoniobacter sp. TaxID=2510640 RepID=UPI0032AD8584